MPPCRFRRASAAAVIARDQADLARYIDVQIAAKVGLRLWIDAAKPAKSCQAATLIYAHFRCCHCRRNHRARHIHHGYAIRAPTAISAQPSEPSSTTLAHAAAERIKAGGHHRCDQPVRISPYGPMRAGSKPPPARSEPASHDSRPRL